GRVGLPVDDHGAQLHRGALAHVPLRDLRRRPRPLLGHWPHPVPSPKSHGFTWLPERNAPNAQVTPLISPCRVRVVRVTDHLVWIDCEMTGLDLGKDALIEIAALVTDADLNVLGDGVDIVIHTDDTTLDGMPQVVHDMHAKSGLTEEVRASTVTLAEA